MGLISAVKNYCRSFFEAYRFRTGRFRPPSGKSILVCVKDTPSELVSEFIAHFRRSHPRENVYFVNRSAVPEAIANGTFLPYPFGRGGSNRYLRKLRTVLVLVDSGVNPPSLFLRRAIGKGAIVAFVKPDLAPTYFVVHTDKSGRGANMACDSKLQGEPTLLSLLNEKMSSEDVPQENIKSRLKFWFWERVVFPNRAKTLRKLSGIYELNNVLGNPGTIVCLGNGPSSEDLQISPENFDSLFRVNHRWLDRSVFTNPDLVFTGNSESVLKVGGDVAYGFLDEKKAMPIIRKVSKKIHRLSFFGSAELGFPVDEFTPSKPTNGLLMIFVAVRLNPDRLIIAGIDLYEDPRGCYPDESAIPNHYTSLHDAAKELDLMLRMLASYNGDLQIVGNKLALEYERYIEAKSQRG